MPSIAIVGAGPGLGLEIADAGRKDSPWPLLHAPKASSINWLRR